VIKAVHMKPTSARNHALKRWNGQTNIPDSPGALTSAGRYELCLGAVLAEAATAALRGTEAAAEFVERLSRNGSKGLIVQQLVSLGWSPDFARSKIAENDRTSPAERKAALLPEVLRFAPPAREAQAVGK
jgi:hypothetical protein